MTWGGTVRDPAQPGPGGSPGWGTEDGTTDIIPASARRFYWYAYHAGAADEELWDDVSVAVASLDAELPTLRWVHETDPTTRATTLASTGDVLVSVSLRARDEAVPAGCGTGCTLATTQCITKAAGAGAPYDLGLHYRVTVYTSRIIATADPGEDWRARLRGVVRHELTHVLGFRHGTGGPMTNGANPLTPCQRATLAAYSSSPSGGSWTTVLVPECA